MIIFRLFKIFLVYKVFVNVLVIIIVYKSWPVQKVANMCSEVALFIPMWRIRFFIIFGPKILHSRTFPGAKVVLSARIW